MRTYTMELFFNLVRFNRDTIKYLAIDAYKEVAA